MSLSDSNHQTVEMPDWIWPSGPDLAPLSWNRVNETIPILDHTKEQWGV